MSRSLRSPIIIIVIIITLIDVTDTLSGQQANVTFSPCFSSVTCEAESFGTCYVTFENNFNNSIQVSGQVNDKISLSNLQVDLRYNYSAVYNSTFVSRGVIIVKCKCN